MKGSLGDSINLMLAATGFNLKKLMRQLQMLLRFLLHFLFKGSVRLIPQL
jgi:hypothetical protein